MPILYRHADGRGQAGCVVIIAPLRAIWTQGWFGAYLHFLYTYERTYVLTRFYRLTATALNAAYVPCGMECSAARLDATGLESSSEVPFAGSIRICLQACAVFWFWRWVTGERTWGSVEGE